jgi:FkbM family methyltransferase
MGSPFELLHRVGNFVGAEWTQRRERAARRRFYQQFIAPGDLVFDVGANFGNRTEIFLALGAYVIAVEPQAECVRCLRHRWGDRTQLTIVDKAVGERIGTGELYVADESTLTSMAPDWIARVRASGRFAAYEWSEKPTPVEVTTLDELMAQHGVPVFCKIDVEGYELEVLRGLNHSVPVVSIEFTAEALDRTADAVDRLRRLGSREFAFSVGESMRLHEDWTGDPDHLFDGLKNVGPTAFGDVYARS